MRFSLDAERRHEAAGVPVLGDVADAARERAVDLARLERPPVELDVAGGRLQQPRDGVGDRHVPEPRSPKSPTHSPACTSSSTSVDVAERGAGREPAIRSRGRPVGSAPAAACSRIARASSPPTMAATRRAWSSSATGAVTIRSPSRSTVARSQIS